MRFEMTEKILQKRDWKFTIGIILTIFWSVVIGFLHIGVIYLFGIPLVGLVLGFIFIWISKKSIKKKTLWTTLCIPIIVATFFVSYKIGKAEPESFLIPQNYRGQIVVFYNEKCGQEPVYENGRRIYNIPESGILITKIKENRGYLDRKFYLLDENGNRSEILEFHWQSFETEKENWKHFNSSPIEEFTKDSVGAAWAYGTETYFLSKNSISYMIINHHYYEKPEKERFLENRQFTKNAESLLKECR